MKFKKEMTLPESTEGCCVHTQVFGDRYILQKLAKHSCNVNKSINKNLLRGYHMPGTILSA